MEDNAKIEKLVNEFFGLESSDSIDHIKEELGKILEGKYTKMELDFAYLMGVFNVSGIDGLHKEIQRLKELGKEPHDIVNSLRKKK